MFEAFTYVLELLIFVLVYNYKPGGHELSSHCSVRQTRIPSVIVGNATSPYHALSLSTQLSCISKSNSKTSCFIVARHSCSLLQKNACDSKKLDVTSKEVIYTP